MKQAMMVWAVLDEFKDAFPHANCSQLQVFIKVALNPGITIGEMQKTMGLPPTATARFISILFEKSRGKTGMGFVETRPDYIDGRVKHLHLTPKGERVWARLKGIMER